MKNTSTEQHHTKEKRMLFETREVKPDSNAPKARMKQTGMCARMQGENCHTHDDNA
jgi:hypothetical protein